MGPVSCAPDYDTTGAGLTLSFEYNAMLMESVLGYGSCSYVSTCNIKIQGEETEFRFVHPLFYDIEDKYCRLF